MSLFKFHDSGFVNGFHGSNIEASTDTYNGYQFSVSGDEAVPFEDADDAKAGDIYVMMNIIDKPEISNTDDYKVVDGEKIRAFRLKDYVGKKVDMSQDLIYFRDTGTKQAETATVAGTIEADGVGNATVIVTASGMANSPKTISVAVENNDTAAQVAGKIRTALTSDADVGHTTTGFFVVSGSDAAVILTAKVATANDSTINISIDNGTCKGLTAALTSANTTPGKLPITTNALMWEDIAVGDYLVPRTSDDTDFPMKWKKVASVTGYEVYLVVKSKTTFGAFTVDKNVGTVIGGVLCEILSTN